MAIISYRHKFIYLLNPRTASTATAKALRDTLPCQFVPKEDILDENGKIVVPKKHTTLRHLRRHEILDDDVLERFFTFVTVRNPFDSLVSLWAKKVKDYAHLIDDPNSWVNKVPGYADSLRRSAGLTYAQWVETEYGPKMEAGKPGYMNGSFTEGVDHILRYENLAEDFSQITGRLGLPEGFELPTVNVTKGRDDADYRTYYDDRSRQIVATVFAREIEALGYDF